MSVVENSAPKDLPEQKYVYCVITTFCKQLLFQKLTAVGSVHRVTNHCINKHWNCSHIFSTGELNILKLFEWISLVKN